MTLTAGIAMEEMSILLVCFHFKLLLRQSLLSVGGASVARFVRTRRAVVRPIRAKALQRSENRMTGSYGPHRPSARKKNNSIDLFCYKKYIYVFPHENISEQAGVDKDKYTSST